MDTAFLDGALADFSGYVAADELYDGPCCMLSAVDNRRDKRLRDCLTPQLLELTVFGVMFLAPSVRVPTSHRWGG